jgi:hypothetical protein
MFVVAAPRFACGQNANVGEIRGIVQDDSGGAIPGAKVVITNVSTGVTQTVETNSAGVYSAPFVPPGTYTVTMSKQGFKSLVQTDVSVQVGTTAVNGTLQVGAVTTEVSVRAEAQRVATESSDRSLEISGRTVTELPNIGQDWTATTALLPGIATAGPLANSSEPVLGSGSGLAFNGTGTYQGKWLVDGGSVSYPEDQNLNLSYDLPLDAVEEVSTVTNNFSAQYTSGNATINVITKSGSNQFHGSLFEFVQNDVFEARNFFSPTVPPLRWNKFGGTVGGPIKRDKAFFFFSFQSNPLSVPSVSIGTFPTAAARQGDFSDPAYPVIYDPNTTTSVNGQTVRTPFAGNVLPPGRLDPVAQKIEDYMPMPNRPGLVNNFYAATPYIWHQHWFIPRVDYNISQQQRISFSGTIEPGNVYQPGVTQIDGYKQPNFDQRYNLSDNWVFSPAFVGEFHMAMDRWAPTPRALSQDKGYPQKLGLLNAPADIFPSISASGTLPISLSPGASARMVQGGYTPSAVLSLTKGKHLIRFGGEYNKFYAGYSAWGDTSAGNFSFSGIFSRDPADQSSAGLGYADFLLGLPQTWSAQEYPFTVLDSWSSGLFVQDDFKIRHNLTLSFGVRYTLQSGWSERHNMVGEFDPTLTNPATQTPGAMWFASGADNEGRHAVQNGDYNNWAPRFGFAWSPGNKWAIRGAYGVFDFIWGADNYAGGVQGVGFTATGYETSTDLLTPVFRLQDGEPNLVYPTKATLTPDLLNGQALAYYPRNVAMPYVQQFHLGVQHEFAGFIADAAFVWTKGTHLLFTTDGNQVPASLLGPGNAQPHRPYPQYANIYMVEHSGLSKYYALQSTLKRQIGRGLTVNANYTWSKNLDTGSSSGWSSGGIDVFQLAHNTAANYGLTGYETPQMLNGGVVYELPLGSGKRFANHGGLVNAAAGGWQVSSVFVVHSGTPFTPVMAYDLSGSLGGGYWYPNRVGSGKLSNPTLNEWFDPSAFTQPAQYTFGNSGRNILFSPGYRGIDISLAKSFAVPWLGEKGRLQVRADASNATNHPNFGGPNNYIGNLGVGQITGAYPARNVQLGAKLFF